MKTMNRNTHTSNLFLTYENRVCTPNCPISPSIVVNLLSTDLLVQLLVLLRGTVDT